MPDPAPGDRRCEGCGQPIQKRPSESARQFAERRFCSRRCSARRPRAGYRGKRERVGVVCATCGVEFEMIPSRVERSESGLLYCSIECQAEARHAGEALAREPDDTLHAALLADARTGRYTIAQLAKRHGHPENTVGVILHRNGVSLQAARARRFPPPKGADRDVS